MPLECAGRMATCCAALRDSIAALQFCHPRGNSGLLFHWSPLCLQGCGDAAWGGAWALGLAPFFLKPNILGRFAQAKYDGGNGEDPIGTVLRAITRNGDFRMRGKRFLEERKVLARASNILVMKPLRVHEYTFDGEGFGLPS